MSQKNVGYIALEIAICFGLGNFVWQGLRVWVWGATPEWEITLRITFFEWFTVAYMWWRLRNA